MEEVAGEGLKGEALRDRLAALGLEERPLDIVQAIIEFKQSRGYSPNLLEIMEAAGIYTKSVVSFHVRQLCQAGWLVRGGQHGHRSLEVAGGRWRWHPPEDGP